MFCRKCGSEIRNDARFCNRCGVPIPNRPGTGEYNRRTIDLPRDETPLRNPGFSPQAQTDRLPPPPLKAPPVPPVNRRPKKPEADLRRADARTQNDLPPLVKPARSNTVIRNQLATTPISLPSPPTQEPEAKPFFTQALTTDKNIQHKRLVTVVPLLLLVVILLFVFAYIAGR
jgi:zinc ribbon protein